MLQQLYTQTLHLLQVVAANKHLWKDLGFKEKLSQEWEVETALKEVGTFQELETYAATQNLGNTVVTAIRKLEVSPNKWLIFTNKQFMTNFLKAKEIVQAAVSNRAMSSINKVDTLLRRVRKIESHLTENRLLIQKSLLTSADNYRVERWGTTLNNLVVALRGLPSSKVQPAAVIVEVDSEKLEAVATNLMLLDAQIIDVVSYLKSCKEADISTRAVDSSDMLGVLLFSSENVEESLLTDVASMLTEATASPEIEEVEEPTLVEEIFVPTAVSKWTQKEDAVVNEQVYTERYAEPETVISPSWACRQDAEESNYRYSAPSQSFEEVSTEPSRSDFSQDSDTSSCTSNSD